MILASMCKVLLPCGGSVQVAWRKRVSDLASRTNQAAARKDSAAGIDGSYGAFVARGPLAASRQLRPICQCSHIGSS